jgi:D-3-phosphoglycerate dehydrogenase
MLILISDAFDPSLPDLLSKYGEVTDDKGRLADAEIVLIRSKTKATREYIDSAPKLKLIIRGGVGLDNVDQEYAATKGVIVKNTADASTTAVAELTFALMMAMPNHLVKADNSMHEGKWLKKELKRTELFGKTLGILGMGRIGTSVAIRANAFQMKVLAWHPDVYFCDFAEIWPSMEEVMKVSDYLTIHMPLIAPTRGIINKENLALCKDGVYIVNTGRGPCVVEEDMAEALKSGKVAGYATDVWASDPPENSPLLEAPNCLCTPHIGASSKENLLRIGSVIDTIIGAYTKGEPLL